MKKCGCAEVVAGVVGLAKAATGIDRADEATIERRRAICRECPSAERRMSNRQQMEVTAWSQCAECGCLLKAKTVIAGETCPAGKW